MIEKLPKGEQIVAMVSHNGRLYVATQRKVYRLAADSHRDRWNLEPLFYEEPNG